MDSAGTFRRALTRENRSESKSSSTNPESEHIIRTNEWKSRFDPPAHNKAKYTYKMLLSHLNKAVSTDLPSQSDVQGLLSVAAMVVILSVTGLLLITLVLARSTRRIKARRLEKVADSSLQQDVWMEAGRRLLVKETNEES